MWLPHLLADLGYSMNSPTTVFEDNQGAIELSKNAKFNNRTKHIDVAYHFVRARIHSKDIIVTYCPSEEMRADIVTKGLPRASFEKFRAPLNIHKVV